MEIAACCGASGWVSGIIGVHPWELAFFDDRAQQEVWGDDPDTWLVQQLMEYVGFALFQANSLLSPEEHRELSTVVNDMLKPVRSSESTQAPIARRSPTSPPSSAFFSSVPPAGLGDFARGE